VISVSNPEATDDFHPKILIVGAHARARAPLVHGFLKEKVRRYGLVTAGVEPVDSVAGGVLQLFEEEEISPEGIHTGPLGRAVNENLRLIIWVSEQVQKESPVIAASCEKLVFDLPDPAKEIDAGKDPTEVFYDLRDRVKQTVVPRVLNEIQS